MPERSEAPANDRNAAMWLSQAVFFRVISFLEIAVLKRAGALSQTIAFTRGIEDAERIAALPPMENPNSPTREDPRERA